MPMQISKFARLLALTEAHTSHARASPKRKRFKPLNVNAAKFGIDWARQRSAAAQMMALVVSRDSESLFQTVSADSKTAATFEDAVGWLESEAAYLRKFSNRLDTAATRLGAVIARYKEAQEQAP